MLTNNLVVSQEDFDSLNAYYSDSSVSLNWNLVFTLPAWLRVWWKHFSSGADLYLRSVSQNSQIIGIAPLQIRNSVASIIGNINVSDYQDFIISPGYERDFYTAILDDLKKKEIQTLHLETVRPDSTIVTSLLPLVKNLGYQVDYHQTDVSSDIQLPNSWDEYLKVLDSKQRHELKRKLRNLKEVGETGYKIIKDKSLVPEAIDTFVHLFPEARRDKAEFL
jgi:CelD/BcsL family acetyltransferase involved in cellulose biosynthesis